MSCSCHLCEPWNKLAQECDDAERLNELRAQRLATHGLTPKEAVPERKFPPPSPKPVRLSDFAEDLWKHHEEQRLREYLRSRL